MEKRKEVKQRDYNIDLLKSIAIFATIMIHANAIGTQADMYSKTWYYAIINGSLYRYCVPLFLMCIGALLYSRPNIQIKDIFKIHIKKILKAMLVAGIIYKTIIYSNEMLDGELITPIHYHIVAIINGDIKYHIYFLEYLIGIYLMYPLTKNMIDSKDNKMIIYFISLWFVIGFISPYIEQMMRVNLPEVQIGIIPLGKVFSRLHITNVIIAIGYTVWGYILYREKERLKHTKIVRIAPLILLIMIVTIITTLHIGGMEELDYTWGFTNPIVLLYTTAIFAIGLIIPIKERFKPTIEITGKSTMFIYLYHVIIIDELSRQGIDMLTVPPEYRMYYPYIVTLGILSIGVILYGIGTRKTNTEVTKGQGK